MTLLTKELFSPERLEGVAPDAAVIAIDNNLPGDEPSGLPPGVRERRSGASLRPGGPIPRGYLS
jgi:hypothetical protein